MEDLWKEVIALLAAVVLATIQLWNRQAIMRTAREAQEERENVKATLETVTYETDSKLNVIHDLVNKAHGEALRLAVGSTRRLAEITKDPADIETARDAQRLYDDYLAKQGLADIRSKTRARGTKE